MTREAASVRRSAATLAAMEPEPREEVFFHGHPSWRSMFDLYAKGLIGAVLAGALAGVVTAIVAGHVQIGWVIAVVLACFLVLLALALTRRLRTTYTVTNERLTIDVGLLSRDLHHTRLERVQNVNCTQTLPQRVLSVGNVDFDTAAKAEFDFSFRGVSNPREIVRTVDRALRESRHEDPV
jgi:uncharacterized membrane protein YdbT with pleckstrin-like domain